MQLAIEWRNTTRDPQYTMLLEERMCQRLIDLHGSEDEAYATFQDFVLKQKPPMHEWNRKFMTAWQEVAPMLSPTERLNAQLVHHFRIG